MVERIFDELTTVKTGLVTTGGFKRSREPCPRTWPQERSFGASGMHGTHSSGPSSAQDHARGAQSGGAGASCPSPRATPSLSALWASGFGPSDLTTGPKYEALSSQHDGLDAPKPATTSAVRE